MTKTDRVCLAPWSSHSPGGDGHSTTKQLSCDFGWWQVPRRPRKQRKGTEVGGRGTASGKPCSAGDIWPDSWRSWESELQEALTGRRPPRTSTGSRMSGVCSKKQGLWLLPGVGLVRGEAGVRLIAETLLAMVSFAFIPSVTGSHWQEREAIWLRFYSCRNISKEILACSTEGPNPLVAKNADTCKRIRKPPECPPVSSRTVALLDIHLRILHSH